MKIQNLVLSFILLAATIGFTGCAEKEQSNQFEQAVSSSARGKLFIIGGGNRPASLKDAMIEESSLRDGGYAVVLPMASSNQDTASYYGTLQFEERGYKAVAYRFGGGDEVTRTRLDSVRNAEMIYIPGGVQSRFMSVVEKYPEIRQAVADAYHNGSVIAGTSAGAAIMSKIMITGDQKRHTEYTSTFYHLESDNIVTGEGMGLITGIIVDQHFIKRSRNNRLLTAVMEFPDHIGVGIDESTAVVITGDTATVVGESQVLVYQNRSGAATTRQEKLGARNLRLDIYLPGESFKL